MCICVTETLGDALTNLYAVPELRKIDIYKRWYVFMLVFMKQHVMNNEISNTVIDVLESVEQERIDGERTHFNVINVNDNCGIITV